MKKTFFILLLFLSCKEYVFDYKPELNVHCILRNDRERQKIRISRTYRMDEVSRYDLKDLNVTIYSKWNDSILCDTFILSDSMDETLGIYTTRDKFKIFPNGICSLIVTAKYQDTIHLDTLFGRTIIPDTFSIISPSNNDTVNINDTIKINDSSVDQILYYIQIFFEDGSFTDKWTFNKEISLKYILFAGSGFYKVKVFKCDKNFYDYYYSDMFEDKVLRCGVSGGVGLFGSMLAESVYFYGYSK